ncbi:hypothetical protein V3C52_10980 [Escherichia coli]
MSTEKDYPVKIPKWVYDRITEITDYVVGIRNGLLPGGRQYGGSWLTYGWKQTMMAGLYALSGISVAAMPVSWDSVKLVTRGVLYVHAN